MRRFLRGLLWGGVTGAMLALYLTRRPRGGGPGGDGERLYLRRLRRAALGEAVEQAMKRPHGSPLQVALDAGRAAVDATLALLGRRV